VAFGDLVQDYEEAELLARAARVFLVVGTTGEVFPAASLPAEARAAGAVLLEVTTGRTCIHADVRLEGEAGSVLPSLLRVALPG
jgi:NAD-dependent deacetylase